MAVYTLTTQNARQDTALTYVAQKAGAASVDAFVQGEFARIVQRALNERDRDRGDTVAAAYNAATASQQAQVNTILGLP